jgi:hypothetical protein
LIVDLLEEGGVCIEAAKKLLEKWWSMLSGTSSQK